MLGKSFGNNSRSSYVFTEVGSYTFGIAVGKISHYLEVFVRTLDEMIVIHVG